MLSNQECYRLKRTSHPDYDIYYLTRNRLRRAKEDQANGRTLIALIRAKGGHKYRLFLIADNKVQDRLYFARRLKGLRMEGQLDGLLVKIRRVDLRVYDPARMLSPQGEPATKRKPNTAGAATYRVFA